MLSENSITTNWSRDLGSLNYTSYSKGNISKFWVKDEEVSIKVAFAIQNQRYL